LDRAVVAQHLFDGVGVEIGIVLLDDTYGIARSPNTQLLLTEARERADGITDATTESRIAELARRYPLIAAINSERRTQQMIDSELDRLGLR
jgi:hypothetical protein